MYILTLIITAARSCGKCQMSFTYSMYVFITKVFVLLQYCLRNRQHSVSFKLVNRCVTDNNEQHIGRVNPDQLGQLTWSAAYNGIFTACEKLF